MPKANNDIVHVTICPGSGWVGLRKLTCFAGWVGLDWKLAGWVGKIQVLRGLGWVGLSYPRVGLGLVIQN